MSQPAAEPLQGFTFVFQSSQERLDAVEKAFDYRGDITLTLSNGKTVEGYLFNRDTKTSSPWISLFTKDSSDPLVIPLMDITSLGFTGRNTADGKSWRDWISKKESDRHAEAEKIKQELAQQGYL